MKFTWLNWLQIIVAVFVVFSAISNNHYEVALGWWVVICIEIQLGISQAKERAHEVSLAAATSLIKNQALTIQTLREHQQQKATSEPTTE